MLSGTAILRHEFEPQLGFSSSSSAFPVPADLGWFLMYDFVRVPLSALFFFRHLRQQ
jgi:hypothetical protein